MDESHDVDKSGKMLGAHALIDSWVRERFLVLFQNLCDDNLYTS
jgi:hypothetical protein